MQPESNIVIKNLFENSLSTTCAVEQERLHLKYGLIANCILIVFMYNILVITALVLEKMKLDLVCVHSVPNTFL